MSDFDDRDSFDQPRPGMSTAAKVILALCGLSFLSLLLCCGGIWWFARNAIAFTDKPEEINRIREKIVRIDIPVEYQPQGAMSLKMVFQMDMAIFTRGKDDDSGGLVLMQMSLPGQHSEEEMRQQFQQQRQQQGQDRKIDVETQEVRTFTIDGREIDFEFLSGTNPDTGKAVHHVTGIFPGRNGTAFFMLFEDDEHWNEERVMTMIESITAR